MSDPITVTVESDPAPITVALDPDPSPVNVTVTLAGDRGPVGDTGPANTLSVGTVTTGAAGSSASATITGTAPTQTLNLTIPRGDTGATGSTGATGAAGAAATVAVGTVTTGAAGSSASVTNAGSSSAAVFNFTIPRGDTGATGATGAAGADGSELELRVDSGYVQWRLVGDPSWTNLVALSSITGPAGAAGGLTIGALIALS